MKLAWATDIHLNFLESSQVIEFGRTVKALEGDIFVVTGDIAEAPTLVPLLAQLAEHSGCPSYFVLGNHDFYRGAIDPVRRAVRLLAPSIGSWLPASGPVTLAEGVILVGVDGWGDAREGDPVRSPVQLNDFHYIDDLRTSVHLDRIDRLRALGDEEALEARRVLDAALGADPHHIVFATHVPPFREACLYEGRPSDDDWAPYFICRAVGDVLIDYAEAHPDCRFTVLCGHTHCLAEVQLRPNLEVRTGAAEYGRPEVTILEFQ